MIALRLAIAAWPLAGLMACASLAPPSHSSIAGRLAIRVDDQEERMVNVGFELNGDAQAGQLTLSGPLGMLGAQAHWGQGKAWLITASGRTNYDSLDALIAAALGEAIPVAALFDWLRGRPWRGADHVMSADGRNGFEQLGWRIDLSRWTTGHLQAQRQVPPIVTLRVVMERD